jgi:ubiquinone/menaquinone biosynthesis C-methylase UbiE
LILGEGPGRFLPAVAGRWPEAEVTVVESSEGMIHRARAASEREDWARRLAWVCADALAWQPPPEPFDLVATHFFLDCFRASQLSELVPKLAGCLRTGGAWLIADFCMAERGWRRRRSQAILWLMYRFFRAATGLPARELTPPDTWLEASGLRLEAKCCYSAGLLHSDLWRMV